MVYPYLGYFRDGLGVSLSTLSVILTIKSLVGACGPLLATIADSKGRKTGMLLGLSIFTIGALLVVIWPTFPVFIVAIMLTVLGKYIFDPSMHIWATGLNIMNVGGSWRSVNIAGL
jgi:predicted MFS family arabinose efflux permease